jgi:hypothetical protein
MVSARWLVFAGAVLLAALVGQAGEGPAESTAKMPREPEKAAPSDESRPGTVTLTQKEYQDLIDRLARLEGSTRPEPPSSCKLSARVVGDVVRLHAEYGFRTGPRRTRVALGCPQGYPTEARIDGHFPVLRWGTEGFTAQVDDPGDHHLALDMDLPLLVRDKGAERGFDLDLPAAATTTLEMQDLPVGVRRATVRAALREASAKAAAPKEFKVESSAGGPGRFATPGLGPAERVEVTWEGQAPTVGPPLLGVTSRIVIHVDERNVTTHAELVVSVRRGLLKELRLLVPPEAVLHVADEAAIEAANAKAQSRTVRFKPTADPQNLTIDMSQPRGTGTIPIGPFLVLGAFPQSGDILIIPPGDVSLDYRARGESQYLLTQREPTDEEKRQAANLLALHYSTLPGVQQAEPSPFFDLAAERQQCILLATITHALRLVRGDGDRPGVWRVTTTIEAQAQPYYAEAAELLVKLPDNYTLDESAGPLPADADLGRLDPGRHLVQFLIKPPRRRSFKLTFEGQYDLKEAPARNAGQVSLTLPTLASRKIDRSAQVSVSLPPDLELVPQPGPLWDAGKPDGPSKRTWLLARPPERFEIAWRPYQPRLGVNADVRIKLLGRQAAVNHRLWLPPGQQLPEQLVLTVPDEVIGLAVAGTSPARDGMSRIVTLPPTTDRDHPLVLDYSFRLPERAADRFKVPLIWPRAATDGETRVCVWSDPGTRPGLEDGPWELRRIEEVKEEGSYPSLVLLTQRPGASLTLAIGEATGGPLPTFRVERVLVQVRVGESGQQSYRARLLVSQIASPWLDVELPAALFRPNPPELAVLLNGKAAVWRPIDEAGKETAVSRMARVQVPADLTGKPLILEVDYALLPGRAVLQTVLQAPQLRGDPSAAPVRWQVVLPPSWVPLAQEALGTEYGWGRRGWLVSLRPTVSTEDFERWFAGSDLSHAEEVKPFPDPTVTAWRSGWEPLRLSHVPERPWLLVCSLTLLIVGLTLAFLALPRALFWGTLAAAGVAALLAGLFWPGVLGAILYGCEPGALVLLPVLAVQWLMHRRYRRQVVFLPGFTRVKAGSSLIVGSSNRTRGEPSTVDGDPAAASAQGSAEAGSKKSAEPGA